MDRSSYAFFSRFGNGSVENLGSRALPAPEGYDAELMARHQLITWRPTADLKAHLPPNFSIAMCCYEFPDGSRRFVPALKYRSFFRLTFDAGLAILTKVQDLDAESRNSYRMSKFIFELSRTMREYYSRKIETGRDLYIRPRGRESANELSILPDGIGLHENQCGRCWTPSELAKNGRQVAKDLGMNRPTKRQIIALGLWEAAKRRPLFLADGDEPALVRSALFAPPPEGGRDERLDEIIIERIQRAFHRHSGDNDEEFDLWLWGPKSNFIKAIADKPKNVGGRLPRDDVRRVMLRLAWGAYGHVGNCIDAFARYFERSLPEPLTDQERLHFEHTFLGQSYLGKLPLVLLLERATFIRSAVTDIWENPGDVTRIAVFHRLLWYYAEMASRRREIDLRFKRKAAEKGRGAKLVFQVGSQDCQFTTSGAPCTTFDRIAEGICRERGIKLSCLCTSLRARLAIATPEPKQPLAICFWCDCGNSNGEMQVPWDEFVAAVHAAAKPEE